MGQSRQWLNGIKHNHERNGRDVVSVSRRNPRPLLSSPLLCYTLLSLLLLGPTPLQATQSGSDALMITTYAGGGKGDLGPADKAILQTPFGVAIDGNGTIYISEGNGHRVRAVSPEGIIRTVAGTGVGGYNGDGIPASAAMLNNPRGLAVDGRGNLYVADSGNNRVRVISAASLTISTLAGTGVAGFSGDGLGVATFLNAPGGVAVDPNGDVIIADTHNCRIRKVFNNGTMITIAGTETQGHNGDSLAGTSASLNYPFGVVADAWGNILFADTLNNRICNLSTDGFLTTLAGNATVRSGTFFGGDGGPASLALLRSPYGIAVNASTGTIYIADTSNSRIRAIYSNATIVTFVGNGVQSFNGDGIFRTGTSIGQPNGLALDNAGRLIFAETNSYRVRRVLLNDTVATIAGVGGSTYITGDGGPATLAECNGVTAAAVDPTGNLFISDTLNNRIRKVSLQGTITTIAGNSLCTATGDGGPASLASLCNPSGLAFDSMSNLWIADSLNCRIRKITTAGIISTVAGMSTCTFNGDGPGTSVALRQPRGVSLDSQGNVWIADTSNHRLRVLFANGSLITVAGSAAGYSGDGGPAKQATLWFPIGVAVAPNGDVLIADASNHRIRRVSVSTMFIYTIAGDGRAKYAGDGGPAWIASLRSPTGVYVSREGDIFIVDRENYRIRRIMPDNSIATVAGAGAHTRAGDGSFASSAALHAPYSLTGDAWGNYYVSEIGGGTIRALWNSRAFILSAQTLYVTLTADPLAVLIWYLTTPPSPFIENISSVSAGGFPCGTVVRVNSTVLSCMGLPIQPFLSSSTSQELAVSFIAFGMMFTTSVKLPLVFPPSVTSVTPVTVEAGQTLTIFGRNLQVLGSAVAPDVTIGGMPCLNTTFSIQQQLIQCTLPYLAVDTPGYPTVPIVVKNSAGQRSNDTVCVIYPTKVEVDFIQGDTAVSCWPSSRSKLVACDRALLLLLGGRGTLSCSAFVNSCTQRRPSGYAGDNVPQAMLAGTTSMLLAVPLTTAFVTLSFDALSFAATSGTSCYVNVVCRDENGITATTTTPIVAATPSFAVHWALSTPSAIVQPSQPLVPMVGTIVSSFPAATAYTDFSVVAATFICSAALFDVSVIPLSTAVSDFGAEASSIAMATITGVNHNLTLFTFNALAGQNCKPGGRYWLHAECTWGPTNERIRLPAIPIRIMDIVVEWGMPSHVLTILGYSSQYMPARISIIFPELIGDPLIVALDAPVVCATVPSNTSLGTTQILCDSWSSNLQTFRNFSISFNVSCRVNGPPNTWVYVQTRCQLLGKTVETTPFLLILSTVSVVSTGALPATFIPSDASSPYPVQPEMTLAMTAYTSFGTMELKDVTCTISSMSDGAQIMRADVGDALTAGRAVTAATDATGIIRIPPFIIHSSFNLSTVTIGAVCVRSSGDASLPLMVELSNVQLYLVTCVPPVPEIPLLSSLPPFTFGITSTMPEEDEGDVSCMRFASPVRNQLPRISCSIYFDPEASSMNDTNAVFLQRASAAMDALTHTVTFSDFAITAPQNNTYGFVTICYVGAIALPQPVRFQVAVSGCPPGMEPSDFTCVRCGGRSFSLGGRDSKCISCPPAGAVCTKGSLSLLAGFYRPASQAAEPFGPQTQLYPCYNTEACTLNKTSSEYGCAMGYSGPLCSVCDAGAEYTRIGNFCRPCWSTASSASLLTVLLSISCWILWHLALRKESHHSEASTALRILMSFLQTVAMLRTLRAGATNTYRTLMEWTEVFTTFPLSIGALRCLIPMSYLLQYVLTIAFPAMIAITVLCIVLLATTVRAIHCRHSPVFAKVVWCETVRTWWQGRWLWGVLSFCLFLAYLPITSASLRTLVCHYPAIDGVVYLQSDMTVECFVGQHASARIIAYITLILVGIGFPFALVWILGIATREKVTDPRFQASFGALFSGYRLPDAQVKQGSTLSRSIELNGVVWWVALVLARQAGITGLAVLVSNPYLQIVGTTMLFLGSLQLHLHCRPYVRPLFQRAEALSLSASLLTTIISTALLQFNADASEGQQNTISDMGHVEWIVTVLLFMINIGTALVLGGIWFWFQFRNATLVQLMASALVGKGLDRATVGGDDYKSAQSLSIPNPEQSFMNPLRKLETRAQSKEAVQTQVNTDLPPKLDHRQHSQVADYHNDHLKL